MKDKNFFFTLFHFFYLFLLSGLQTHSSSHHGLAFAFLTVTGEEVGFSKPVVSILRSVQKVNVADKNLEMENNAQHLGKKKSCQ